MEDLIKNLSDMLKQSPEKLKQWKERTGKKIIGCIPMYVPEEVIHAAGILPVTLLGSDEPVTAGEKYLPSFVCHPMRSNLDQALKGRLDFLDGIIFPDVCDTVRSVSDVWRYKFPSGFYYHLIPPIRLESSLGKEYLTQQLVNLKVSLEKFCGREISEADIRRSISVYNENRLLLRRLYRLRRGNASVLRASDIATIVMAGMSIPKEEHNELLTRLLDYVEARPARKDHKIKLVLSGHLCEEPELEVLHLVEDLGGVIVDDDLYVGSRYFSTTVDEALGPLEGLVERYFRDVPCPTKYNPAADWGDYLVNKVKESGAQGIIVWLIKFCDPHAFRYPYLKEKLGEASIPHLLLETMHGGATGAIRTRLQAFLEMLGEGKGGS